MVKSTLIITNLKEISKITQNNNNNVKSTKVIHYKTWPQHLAALTANICLVSLGMNFGWSSPSLPQLLSPNTTILISSDDASWITSVQPLGDFVGAPLAAFFCDYLGRKQTILLTCIPHFCAWCLIGFSTTAWHLILARFISGISEGAIFICVPMYIGEIAVPEIRGILGTEITLGLIFGIFLINLLGGLIENIHTVAFIASIVPIITFITFVWMPKSPYYCLMKNNAREALINLQRLRGSENVNDEINTIENFVNEQMNNPTTLKTIFWERTNRRAFIIIAWVRILQQFCGISALTYYLMPIFNESNVNLPTLTATLVYMSGQILSTVICVAIVDHIGRKPLLFVSLIGASLSLLTIGTYFFLKDFLQYNVTSFSITPLIGMLSYIILFSLGYGTLPTLLLSEFFAANVKAKSLCLIHFIFAFFLFFSAKSFLFMQTHFGTFVPFWFYGVSALCAIIFTIIYVPETRGKSLEEIQDWFRK